jgi:hypothetical protein
MTFAGFYLICLVVGVVMSFLTLLSAGGDFHFHGHLPFGLHFPHFGHHGLTTPHADAGVARLASFNFSALMAFLAAFGGAGFLLTRHLPLGSLLTLILAVVAGSGAATIVNAFMVKVLMANVRELAPAQMVGTLATVTVPIREGGTGEIVYVHEDARCSAGARSDSGEPIVKGSEVIVVRYERGIAYVRAAQSFARQQDELETPSPGGASAARLTE